MISATSPGASASCGASPGRVPESAASRPSIARQRSSSERMSAASMALRLGQRADLALQLAARDRDCGERRAELVRRAGGEAVLARRALAHPCHRGVPPLEVARQAHDEVGREQGRHDEGDPHALEVHAEVLSSVARVRVGRARDEQQAVAGDREPGEEPRPARAEHRRGERDVDQVEDAEGIVGAAAQGQQRRDQQRVERERGATEQPRRAHARAKGGHERVARRENGDREQQPRQREPAPERLGDADRAELAGDGAPAQPDQPVEADVAAIVRSGARRQGGVGAHRWFGDLQG